MLEQKHTQGFFQCRAIKNKNLLSIKVYYLDQSFLKAFNNFLATKKITYFQIENPVTFEKFTVQEINLKEYDFWKYISQNPINGLYFHLTFEELIEQFYHQEVNVSSSENTTTFSVPTLTPLSKLTPSQQLQCLVQQLLGKYYAVFKDKDDFEPKQISFSLLIKAVCMKNHIASEEAFLTSYQDEIDIEDWLYQKFKKSLADGDVLLKGINALWPHNNAQDLQKTLNFLKSTGVDRHNQTHSKVNSYTTKFHPVLQVIYPKQNNSKSVQEKNAKIHGKRTATSFAPPAITTMSRYNSDKLGAIVLFFFAPECQIHHKYVFSSNAYTNGQWWYNFQTGGAKGITYTALKSSISSISSLSQPQSHNELLAGLPQKGIRCIGVDQNNLTSKINALKVAFTFQKEFGLDYPIPLMIVPVKGIVSDYSYSQRIEDVMQSFED